jgi:hypothetical protein
LKVEVGDGIPGDRREDLVGSAVEGDRDDGNGVAELDVGDGAWQLVRVDRGISSLLSGQGWDGCPGQCVPLAVLASDVTSRGHSVRIGGQPARSANEAA